jgi:hypothetical protein
VGGSLVLCSFVLIAGSLPWRDGDIRTLPHHVHRTLRRHCQRGDVNQDRERGLAGGYSSIGIGAVVARLAAGEAFYSAPLPQWASAIQLLFNAAVVVAVVILGRGGFWNFRGPQPVCGYPILVAGAVLLAAIPLMIAFVGPQYVTFAMPLMAVLFIEGWRRRGEEVITGTMIAWTVAAWLSMIALEVPWNWFKLGGPMTWVLLLLAPASFSLVRSVSMKHAATS